IIRRLVTSAELDHILDAQETSLFVDNVNINLPLQYYEIYITIRHNDVLKLEKSRQQINNIEYFANKTTNNIDGGRVQLRKSE
ncbi:hypothetical protein ALC57_12037, partial [Trachymyrmex cornetzi]